jgi:hypothetical protein
MMAAGTKKTTRRSAIQSNLLPSLRASKVSRGSVSDANCTRPVCIENFIRIDLVRESLNVGHDGRADIPLL